MPTRSQKCIPNNYTGLTSGITINSGYPISGAYADADHTSYTRLNYPTSTTGGVELIYHIDAIPSDATLNSLTGRFKASVNNTSRMTNTSAQLYVGSTAKGSSTSFGSTSASVRNLSPGSISNWNISDFSDLRIKFQATSSTSTSSKIMYIYGTDITIGYTLAGKEYTYTISNVSADHTVLITSDGSATKLYAKGTSTSWSQYSKVWLKVNSTTWVEQDSSTWSSLFDDSKKYRKMT